ncbi:hypothetical protein GUITHDRAFT_163553 [Guillardia theta CCMP2712]|uniref:Uncharacterized protein n=1 Tax=Guillardia theta (strain CCMP2712) TaxID=905079 RepID=L1J7Y8_GUITC|nr:hypothetical protein GUITHDRAFT_163553 [Guillardia theta CCMP2712]EKX44442.1 hypothetical protein GUITHDRAFT_163553 [Guillardia theta CCMP2712]|eukprot:XP_005831422.1 hypothetical protein GUITHDRAFT_163553 [Guillardia theta CCMP2712]
MAIGNLRGALGTMAVGLLACSLIVLMGRGRLSPQPSLLRQKRWSPAMGTNSVFLPKHPARRPDHKALLDVATFQQLAENPNCCNDPVVPVEEVYQDFNMCQSCLAECSAYKANDCSFGSMSAACLPDALLTECEECATKGCTQVVEFIEGNAILNETSNGDNITKVEIFTELAWAHAQKEAVADLPVLKKCIDEASTVGLAEKCLAKFMHSFPATILLEASSVAETVGPPTCSNSYTGVKCDPLPKPSLHGNTCPQGFMCMPDPMNCVSCACSCNAPDDKIANLEQCLTKAKNAKAGSFCLASLFTQLPPGFVQEAVKKANEPRGASEHYSQIFEACGGGENGTAIVSSCLQQIEYCVRPFQGKPGSFPSDFKQFQPICECFGKEEVLTACGETEEEQMSCATAIREHYVLHVHHNYCLHNTEPACDFQCKWPLPGFFGEVAQAGGAK